MNLKYNVFKFYSEIVNGLLLVNDIICLYNLLIDMQ